MRLACALSLASLSLLGTSARADTGPPMACSSQSGKFTVQLNMGLVAGSQSVNPTDAVSLVNRADCQCDAMDLGIEISATMGVPIGQTPTFEAWVGSNCDNYMVRTGGNKLCEKLQTDYTYNTFQTANMRLYVRVPARSLISPVDHMCTSGSTNSVYFIFYTDATKLDSVCSITIPTDVLPPSAPLNFTGGSGDKAVNLKWTAPTTDPPLRYQVLCATADGNPVKSASKYNRGYSTCSADGLQRRNFVTGGGVVTPDDAGVSSDLGTMSSSGGLGETSAGGAGGGSGGGGGLGTQADVTEGPAPFTGLNAKFICSDPLDATNTGTTIDGLENNVEYQFLVVGIDAFGNPTPAKEGVIKVTPKPVEDLYRRFRADGGAAQGFCFIATAAHGSPQSPYVKVLRRFRDEVLLPTEGGRGFVDWYYRHAPPAATWLAERPTARAAVRTVLWPVIALAALWLWLGPVGIVLLGGGAGGLVAWRSARRRRRAA